MDRGYKKPRRARYRKPSGRKPGRPKGSEGKATIERRLQAEAAANGGVLAKDRLEYAMDIYFALMEANRPKIVNGRMVIGEKEKDVKRLAEFHRCADAMINAASTLVGFQSPKLSAIAIAPPRPESKRMSFTLNIFDNDGTKQDTFIDGVRQIEGAVIEDQSHVNGDGG